MPNEKLKFELSEDDLEFLVIKIFSWGISYFLPEISKLFEY
jgi:hypothetical protein